MTVQCFSLLFPEFVGTRDNILMSKRRQVAGNLNIRARKNIESMNPINSAPKKFEVDTVMAQPLSEYIEATLESLMEQM